MAVFVIILAVIFCISSCGGRDERIRIAKSFILLKNGEKISLDEYLELKRLVAENGLVLFLQSELKKQYKIDLSGDEIREVVYSDNIRVVLEKSEKNNQATAQEGR